MAAPREQPEGRDKAEEALVVPAARAASATKVPGMASNRPEVLVQMQQMVVPESQSELVLTARREIMG